MGSLGACFIQASSYSGTIFSDSSHLSDGDSMPYVLLANKDVYNKGFRQTQRWEVAYQGHGASDMVDSQQVENFKGCQEERTLFVSGLIHRQLQDFVAKKNSLLTETSRVLEESMSNSSGKEYVAVRIHELGQDDYKINLNYTYHAFNPENGSFDDEVSSRSQDVSSVEEIRKVVKNFVQKHRVGPVCAGIELSSPVQNVKKDSPLRKRPRTELKQLTLERWAKPVPKA